MIGRTLTANEIIGMNMAANIVMAWRSRAEAENWAKWAKENPEANEILCWAMAVSDGSG